MLLRGVIGSLLVLLGGLGTSALPESSLAMELGPLVAIRGSEAGRMVSLAVVMAGLGLLAAQWLLLCRVLALHRGEGVGGGIGEGARLAVVARAAAAWSLPLLAAPPLFSRDGWSYAAQARLIAIGRSPYEYGPSAMNGPVVEAVDPRWLDTPAPYGPLWLATGSLPAELTNDPWLLVICHRLMALVGLGLMIWALPRLARWVGVDPPLATATVVTSPLVIAHGVGGLHNDLLAAGLAVAALCLAVERGWVVGAVVAGLAASVKAPGGLIAVAVVLVALPAGATLVQRVRRTVGVAAVSTGVVVGLGLLTGLGLGWIDALAVPSSIATPLSVTTMLGQALDTVTSALGLSVPWTWDFVVRGTGTVVLIGVAATVTLMAPSGERRSALRAAAVVTVAAVVLSPVVHLWYLLWCVPFVVVAAPAPRTVQAVVGVSLIAGLAAPLDSSLHGAYLAVLLGSLILAGLLLVLLLTRVARARVRGIAEGHRTDPVGAGHP